MVSCEVTAEAGECVTYRSYNTKGLALRKALAKAEETVEHRSFGVFCVRYVLRPKKKFGIDDIIRKRVFSVRYFLRLKKQLSTDHLI